ncbi:hypothetical protein TWF481_003885 [Arthrobotrys musiformis]|uniref:Uncharacterized protein n=1 Tax=Arthrobotrys musiformis TaxID=47236 RepID=A0AAV9WJH1_9PEZI
MSSNAPEPPIHESFDLYDDSHHHTENDTVWTYNGCTFKRITKKEPDGSIVELRNGGILSCPICPEIGVMTTLSNLVGHLVAKNHAQRFYHLWSLRGVGNNNAEPMLLFQESWETANHLKILRAKRLEKIDRAVIAQHEYTWDRLKNRFNTLDAEGTRIGAQDPHQGQFFTQGFDLLNCAKNMNYQIGGPEWSQLQPYQDRLLGPRVYHLNRGISSVRNSGQQVVTSVFRQAKDRMAGVKGPLSEITGNPRKRRAPDEEDELATFRVPKRPFACNDFVVEADQATSLESRRFNQEEEPQSSFIASKIAPTLGLQFPWTDEQVAEARALKAKIANSEQLTPEEEESYKNCQQLCFLLDAFEEMDDEQNSSTTAL